MNQESSFIKRIIYIIQWFVALLLWNKAYNHKTHGRLIEPPVLFLCTWYLVLGHFILLAALPLFYAVGEAIHRLRERVKALLPASRKRGSNSTPLNCGLFKASQILYFITDWCYKKAIKKNEHGKSDRFFIAFCNSLIVSSARCVKLSRVFEVLVKRKTCIYEYSSLYVS